MSHLSTAALALPALAGFAAAAGSASSALEVALKDKPTRSFAWELPAENWQPVSGTFPIAHAGGASFAVQKAGDALMVDCDGDGQTERRIEGRKDPDTQITSAFVVLESERADGTPLRYGLRLRKRVKGWEWSTSTAAVGKLENDGATTKIAVIDQDGDGVYGEIGEDALVVGSGKVCTFLSETVHVAGELYALQVAADGSSLELAPYEGATGTLDARAELKTEGKLLAAVVRSVDGQHSFDLAKSRGGLKVPAGQYRVHRGHLGLGKAVVTVESGRMKPITVSAEEKTVLTWGGPAQAEFAYHRKGDELMIRPDEVWYYGAAGEEYKNWSPVGKSPEFTIKERKLGTELAKALFPGSC